MMKQSVVALFTNIRNAHTYLNYRATKVWMPHEREARYVSQTVPRQKWTALLEISEQTRKIVSQYMLSKKLTSARSCFSITITMRRTRKHTSTPRKPSRAEKRHQEKKVRAIVPIEMMKMYLRRVWNKRIKYIWSIIKCLTMKCSMNHLLRCSPSRHLDIAYIQHIS